MSAKVTRICKHHGETEFYVTRKSANCVACQAESQRRWNKKNWARRLWLTSRNTSKRTSRKLGDLTSEQIEQKMVEQQFKCALSGLTLDLNDPVVKPSLDRIDSQGPYTADNVQLVGWFVNRMKSDLPQHLFIQLCREVAKHNSESEDFTA